MMKEKLLFNMISSREQTYFTSLSLFGRLSHFDKYKDKVSGSERRSEGAQAKEKSLKIELEPDPGITEYPVSDE